MIKRVAGAAALGATLLVAAIGLWSTAAQPETPATPMPRPPAPGPTPPAPTPPSKTAKPSRISIEQAILLVRATLLTLNDANRSGNYTVLRDLGASEFQARNTAADLALVFTDMRRMNVNLFGVMMLSPQLTSAPEVDSEGRLRLSGYVPIQPVQIKFDLVFESTSGIWKLLNIGISTPQAEQANAQGGQPRPQSGEPKLPAANAKASTKQAPAPKTKPTPPPAPGAPPTQSAKEE